MAHIKPLTFYHLIEASAIARAASRRTQMYDEKERRLPAPVPIAQFNPVGNAIFHGPTLFFRAEHRTT